LDGDGAPHVLYVKSDLDAVFVKTHIHHCYLSGGVWQDVTLDGADYTQAAHLIINGATYYIFSGQLISGAREVVQIKSVDSGANWTKTQITTSSANRTYLWVVPTKDAANGIHLTWANNQAVHYKKIE
jgi:hypothetical protein